MKCKEIAELIERDEYLSQSEKSEYARIIRFRNEREAAKTDDERCEVIANQIVEYGTRQTYSKTFSEYPHFLEDYAQFYFDHSEEVKQKLLACKPDLHLQSKQRVYFIIAKEKNDVSKILKFF